MDVNRQWRRFNHEKYNCGFYTVYRPLHQKHWEIYWDNRQGLGRMATEFLAEVPSLTAAKKWIKSNWRKIDSGEYPTTRNPKKRL